MVINSENVLFIAKGIYITFTLLFGGLAIGILLGATLSYMRSLPYLRYISRSIVSIIRGTPLILQLSIFYFSFPVIFDVQLNAITAGVIAFGINSAAYLSEIIRAGMNSIPKGQFEAAKVLQIPKSKILFDIILPQVLRNIFPAFINEIIALLKETSIVSSIGVLDITRRSQIIAANNFSYFIPMVTAAFFYYLLVLIIEYLGQKLEGKFKF